MPLDTARSMLFLAMQRPDRRTTRTRNWMMTALRLTR